MNNDISVDATINIIDEAFRQTPMEELPCNLVEQVYEIFKEKYKCELSGLMAIYLLGKIN